MDKKRTKIVATISDKNCDPKFINDLFNAGMNVVRINSAHLNPEGALKIITNTRAVSDQIAILIDTKGPEIRTTICDSPVQLKRGSTVRIEGYPEGKTVDGIICVSFKSIADVVPPGSFILIDDGELELKVIKKYGNSLECRVENDGVLGARKSVNIPGVKISLPSLTEKDKSFIKLAIDEDIEFIAHSFVRNSRDVLDVQEILDASGSEIKIIAKIENQEGVENIDEILENV
jgi:pyruvate kinase